VKTDELLPVLWRRRVTFAITFVAVLATVAIVTAQLPKVYYATSYLLVTPARPAASDFETAQVSETLTKTYGQLLRTDNVARAVQRRLGPDVAGGDVGNAVTIDTGDTQLIGITGAGSTGAEAQAVANAYAEVFRERAARFANRTAASADVSIAEPATLPSTPARPRPRLYLIIGAVLAALAGVGMAVLRQRLDQRVDVADADTEVLGLPILARIPARRSKGPAGTDESYRLLLANLAFVNAGQRPRSLVVVSSSEQEGKSTTTLSLARAAAETGLETLVVDADLRRPTILAKLGISAPRSAPGLSSFLVRSALSLTEATVEVDDLPSLRVVPAGPLPPNPAALLASGTLEEFDARARRAYQLVVYDTPPLSIAADASLVAAQGEGVILVVDVRSTRRKLAVQAVEQLRRSRATVLGVVLNRVSDVEDPSYYYAAQPEPVDQDPEDRELESAWR
jgi:polysaccharide biosynthesis transport protein